MEITKAGILSGDSQQLRSLLCLHFPCGDKQLTSDQRLAIAESIRLSPLAWPRLDLDTFLGEVDKQFPGLPALFKVELQFVFRVLDDYVTASQMDEKLNRNIEMLRLVLLAHSIAQPSFWIRPHPLRAMVDFLYGEMIGWQDGFGKNSQELEQFFASAIERIVAIDFSDSAVFQELHRQLLDEFARKTANFDKLANRLKDSETGILKARMSQFVVIDFINKATRGVMIPKQVADFLYGQFAEQMKLLLIKQGLQSPLWDRWKKLVETMLRLYQQGAVGQTDATAKKLLGELPDEIAVLAKETFHEKVREDVLNQISFDFAHFILGNPAAGLSECRQVELPGMVAGVDKDTSKSLVERVRHLKEGQWFLYKDEKTGEVRRCRLLLNLPDYNQLLFANFVGQKVLSVGFEDFAYLLSSKMARPIFHSSTSERVVEQVIDKFLENYEQLRDASVSAARKKDQERQQQEQARMQAQEENARRQAAAKAQAEAEAIAARKRAEIQADAEKEAEENLAKQMAQISSDLKRQARLMIDSLVLGSWIEMQNPATKAYSRVKLAVKFNASGRFVFVDADGVTVADLNRDELIKMVLVKKARLLDSDAKFADRLSKIVASIKKEA